MSKQYIFHDRQLGGVSAHTTLHGLYGMLLEDYKRMTDVDDEDIMRVGRFYLSLQTEEEMKTYIENHGYEIEEIKEPVPIELTRKGFNSVVKYRRPLGLFYIEEDNGMFTGMDNTTGDAFVEEFETEEECISWLKGEIEVC